MATKKKSKTTARASRTAAPREVTMNAREGKAQRGKEWDPSKPESFAPGAPEVNEPRPYTSRYPIPNEAFVALSGSARN